jgi:PKD repeat protein
VRILLLTLGVLLVLAAPATAAPVPSYTVVPNPPIAGEPATFTSTSTSAGQSITRVEWDFQSDGVPEVTDTTPPFTAAHIYPNAGSKTLRLTVTDSTPLVPMTTTGFFNIDVNARPVSRFYVSPDAPVTGERVIFRSVSYDPGGSALSYAWDTDGDGFDDGTGDTASRTFASAGGRLVGLRVTDSDGVSHTTFQTVNVTADRLASAGLSLMNPFPVVRLAGSVYPRGVKVRALEAKTPRRSTVTVLCAGKSCPSKKIVKTAKKPLVRFKTMARFLREGTRLSVSVRKSGKVGKYTRWLIRGGKLPKRKDLCVYPNRRKPARCPAA